MTEGIDAAAKAVRNGAKAEFDGRNHAAFNPAPLGPSAPVVFVFPGSGNHFLGMGREIGVRWPEIYRRMDVVRVYTKLPTAKEPDMERPFTIPRGRTLLDLAGQVHKDYTEGLKFARVWGTAVHDGTVVKGDYELHDRDVVELHL